MKTIAISKFKAQCLALLDQVRRTRRPILVTRFGVPMAEILPPSTAQPPSDWLGRMKGTGKINGDIVAPALKKGDWEVLRR